MRALEDRHLLAQPTRAKILSHLAAGGAPARVEQLAEEIGVHPNTVRSHLEKLESARFVVRRTVEPEGPGRPHAEWSAVGGSLPVRSAYRALATWLVRGMAEMDVSPLEIRETGRSIGRDMATGREPEQAEAAVEGLLAALGFRPVADAPGELRLQSCPFRSAAEENPALVCNLHHGIVEGFTESVDPDYRVTLFEPRPPAEAGCLVHVSAD